MLLVLSMLLQLIVLVFDQCFDLISIVRYRVDHKKIDILYYFFNQLNQRARAHTHIER